MVFLVSILPPSMQQPVEVHHAEEPDGVARIDRLCNNSRRHRPRETGHFARIASMTGSSPAAYWANVGSMAVSTPDEKVPWSITA